MSSINIITLCGNVGADADVKEVNGVKVARFRMATSTGGYKKQDGTEVPERTEWHNGVLWGGLADVAEKYVRKGDKLYIEGKIRTTTYEDQTGIRRYRTEILAENMEMLSYRSANNNPAQGGTK